MDTAPAPGAAINACIDDAGGRPCVLDLTSIAAEGRLEASGRRVNSSMRRRVTPGAISGARVRLAGTCEDLIAEHYRIVGPRRAASSLPPHLSVVQEDHTDYQSAFLVRTTEPLPEGDWQAEHPDLEDLVLAYLDRDRQAHNPHDLEGLR
ncbi:hypothetical protein ACIGZJ_12955 [Kitasatospora sp. NPDC052868]|uniref:hypothetical protein n=1 Tax=Kitasatospora sp. NPDC052868 TaxID=3364060 RepID=UPI0037C95AAC